MRRDTRRVHCLHPELLERRVQIVVVGVGGNGAQMLALLARLDLAMRALGHPYGLYVTAYDPDEVSEANVGRQVWSPSDVGANKAIVAINRLNLFYGNDWTAVPTRFSAGRDHDLLISCVDTRQARRELHQYIVRGDGPRHYWLDLGNEESHGQCVLGEVPGSGSPGGPRLPLVTELFPELLDPAVPEHNQHSCSLRISLQSQGLFINDFVARCAAQLLYRLFSRGQLAYHGALLNLETLRMNPLPIDPAAWRRLGYAPSAADP